RKFGFKGSYVIDWKHNIVNALGAQTTGDVFVLTPERKIAYKGPVDDHHHLSRTALEFENSYLSQVLENILSGKEIEPKKIPSKGCVISRPVLKESISFKDVAPIIKKKCTICHNPKGTAPINFISYKDIAGRGRMFKYVIKEGLMPPWRLDPGTGPWKGDLSLSIKEKAILLKWSELGFPRGRGAIDTSLWKRKEIIKPKPDYIIKAPEKVIVPKEGGPFYKYFLIQNPFKEDKWVKLVKFFFKKQVVHHMNIFIMKSTYKSGMNPRTSNPIGILPILGIDHTMESNYMMELSEHVGIKIPKDSKLVLEIHYEPIGEKVIDNYTKAHIYFHKEKPKYEGTRLAFYKLDLNIPAHKPSHKVTGSFKIEEDIHAFSIYLHMHLRGKAGEIWITDPNGAKKRIFGIDPFLKAFEVPYHFQYPVFISKNSTLECIAWFDNSENNPQNPDPTKNITFGLFLEDEMFICGLVLLFPTDQASNQYRSNYKDVVSTPKLKVKPKEK
ncbi:MAG: hypothetical protein OXB86_02990, partial [Bdellovibrionales bacterium]|nr:hypothetical protein [Bdellovibrionales bacterium]